MTPCLYRPDGTASAASTGQKYKQIGDQICGSVPKLTSYHCEPHGKNDTSAEPTLQIYPDPLGNRIRENMTFPGSLHADEIHTELELDD